MLWQAAHISISGNEAPQAPAASAAGRAMATAAGPDNKPEKQKNREKIGHQAGAVTSLDVAPQPYASSGLPTPTPLAAVTGADSVNSATLDAPVASGATSWCVRTLLKAVA